MVETARLELLAGARQTAFVSNGPEVEQMVIVEPIHGSHNSSILSKRQDEIT